jgi:hypothetical protein
MTNPDPDREFERFSARTREIGLDLATEDIAELLHGWTTLQPFLASIRKTEDEPVVRTGKEGAPDEQ